MYLYVYEGYKGGKEGQQRTEALVLKAAQQYLRETGMDAENVSRQILRAERGKPYFKELPIEFSVSHTGDLWVCVMDTAAVGVDIQQIRKSRIDAIAKRYYTPDEQEYVQTEGEEGFFQLWSRKEAYAKYTGDGITEKLKTLSTLKAEGMEFVDFNIREGVKGSCCMKEKRELWIRTLV